MKKKSQDAGAGQVVSSFKEAENAHCVVQPVCQWVVGWDSRWVVAVRKKKKGTRPPGVSRQRTENDRIDLSAAMKETD